jgi:hypothetical protein
MNKVLEENNYIIVNDLLKSDDAFRYYTTFKNTAGNQPNLFTKDVQCPKSLAIYDYHPFVELLVETIPFLSQVMGEIMLPTYSYARLYKNGDVLTPHTDRGACEVSITLHLGSDGVEWPIYFRKPDNSVVQVNMKPGQAVIYLGCVAEHWRDTYEGNEYGQVFLHYVRSRGPNAKYYFDKVKD